MAKGGGFERENDKELSLWWTGGESDDVFWRTSGSGSRATMRMKKGKSSSQDVGDVRCLDPIGDKLVETFLIEQKTGYTSFGRIDQKGLSDVFCNLADGTIDAKKGIAAVRKLFANTKKGAQLDVLSFVDWPDKHHVLEEWWTEAETQRIAAGRPYSMLIMKRDLRKPCICFSEECFGLMEDISVEYDGNVLRLSYNQSRVKLVIINFEGFKAWISKKHIEILNERAFPATIKVERSNKLWQKQKKSK